MRKLKIKEKEEKKEEVKLDNNDMIINRRLKYIRTITNIVFFIIALFNDKPMSLVFIMSVILGGFAIYNHFTKKMDEFIKRLILIWFLALLAWPINLLIKYLF